MNGNEKPPVMKIAGGFSFLSRYKAGHTHGNGV